MHDHQSGRHLYRWALRPRDDIGEQGAAQPPALPVPSDGHTSGQDAGINLGMFRRVAPARRAGGANGSGASGTLSWRLGLQDAHLAGGFDASCNGIDPILDLLKGCSIGVDG